MKNDLPTSDAILEELADKVAVNIERLAPVAFDGAFREMIRYHKFLLALNASRTPDGAAFNYAEVAGDAWNAPHRDWIRQYRRLFERAVDRIPDDDHFIRTLAYTARRLLPGPGDQELPTNIVRVILDLGPMLMHRLEDWVTKRTTLDIPKGEAAVPRLAMAGSDAKSYANVLPELIGSWEGLLSEVPIIYRWPEPEGGSADLAWSAFRKSWPLLWGHLENTAYCLAVAVWNEDEAGAAIFKEALVRWPRAFDHRLQQQGGLRRRHLLFPTILGIGWKEASQFTAPLTHDYMQPLTPQVLFSSAMQNAHDDVMDVTSSLLLSWTISNKQKSDIGARTALSLLRRETSDSDGPVPAAKQLNLRTLLLNLMRAEMAGERYNEASYSAMLDHLERFTF